MRFDLTALRTIVVLSIIIIGGKASAQKIADYETISTAQGLSQGMIFDILQDQEGFIWVATKNGLNRYDGYSFKVFTNDPYNIQSLSSNTIVKLFEDSKGRIWAGTESAGLNIYNKTNGKFYRITHKNSNPASISGNGIRSIIELPDGRILVATDDARLNIIELPYDYEKRVVPVITRLALPNNTLVYGMGIDQNGITWIGGMDGMVYRYDHLKNNFIKLNNAKLLNDGYLNPDSSKLITGKLYLLNEKDLIPLFDSKKMPAGNIIFKPKRPLWENHHREEYFYDIYKHEPGKPIEWNSPLPESTTRICYPFIIDRSGILWSGSVGYGLRKYNTAIGKFKPQATGNSIRLIIPAANNEIFIVNFAYKWMKIKDNELIENAFYKIPSINQIDNFVISSTGDYWLKCDEMGYFKYNPVLNTIKPYTHINSNQLFGNKQPIFEDSHKNIWFPGLNGTFTLLNTVTSRIDSFSINQDGSKIICTALFEDNQGIFWIGTDNGFAKASFKNNLTSSVQVEWFNNNSSNRNSLSYNQVSCFIDDPLLPDKYLWIATKGGGLNRLDKISGEFLHVTTKDGLPHNVVYGILTDDAGNIWGSTNKGVFCFSPIKNKGKNNWVFRNFTKANGLQDDEFNTGAFAKLPNGNLAFGGVNGLNIFDPKEILSKAFMPNVFITDILVNNKSISPGDKTAVLKKTIEQSTGITLTHVQDILTLEFSSLDFTASSQNKYRFQLVGVDKDWVETGTRRTATYLHLPAGKFVFKIQGSNSQGLWSEHIAQLQITVLPPWWRSWWAYLGYVILIGLIIKAYLRFSVNRARLKSQLIFEQREAKRIKELDTVKTQLYTNITHEFRTPLTVILGMAQNIKNDPPQHFNNGIEMIIRNGQNLLKLVNEMLDLAKLETGKMTLQLVNGDMINFLRYIVESFHSLAESQKKQLHFLAEIDALYMAYDPEKVRQIVTNLLSNALKFTPERGNIYISVSVINPLNETDKSTLIIKVKDTGTGIPENQLQHIFDRFYRVDNSHTRKTDGTGIGLALTKELVKLMEGEITVKSPPAGANKGSEFTVELPFNRSTAEPELMTYIMKEERLQQINAVNANDIFIDEEIQHNEKPLVLLVEDNADVVAYTASCLPDYRLAVAQDGKEGLEIATEIIPDLIITDVMMPLMDGFELCRQLRNNEQTSHIPIIMLTAKADMDSRMEGLLKGADVYLEKPFNREELLVRIKKLLEMRQILQQYYLKKTGLDNNILANEIIDESSISDTMMENAFVKKVRTIIEENLSESNFTVEQLCKIVFMSHSQLHRKLEALTGCSPSKFIRIIRLNRAKALLREPSNSIASVALDCGYNDPGYFARVFKQEYKVTPQEWRGNN